MKNVRKIQKSLNDFTHTRYPGIDNLQAHLYLLLGKKIKLKDYTESDSTFDYCVNGFITIDENEYELQFYYLKTRNNGIYITEVYVFKND